MSRAEEDGWQWRLCAQICAPPIHKIHVVRWSPRATVELRRFQNGILLCFIIGFVRTYAVQAALLGDFMNGGGDFFAALLGLLSLYDCCASNGSLLAMFIIWATTNAVVFDIVFSLGPHLCDISLYTDGQPSRAVWFWADNGFIVLNAGLQLWLVWLARSILAIDVPDWMNRITYGSGAEEYGSAAQPLMGQPPRSAMGSRAPQPLVMGGGSGGGFRAFGGSGQRLSGNSAAADAAERRLAGGGAVLPR